MKIRFQADADLDPDIWRGLCRREPGIDMEGHIIGGHLGVIPDGTSDPEVLKLAGDAGRVLISADVTTMPTHFEQFVERADSPGLILVPSSRSLSGIIEGLLLVWREWTPDQLRNQAWWLPHLGDQDK